MTNHEAVLLELIVIDRSHNQMTYHDLINVNLINWAGHWSGWVGAALLYLLLYIVFIYYFAFWYLPMIWLMNVMLMNFVDYVFDKIDRLDDQMIWVQFSWTYR